MSGPPIEQPRGNRFYLALIAITTLVAFGESSMSEFTWLDDAGNIWQNPRLNPPTLDGIAHYWRHSEFGLYIPLTYSVWGALAKFAYVDQADTFGAHLNPWVFHSFSVFIHVISALTVFAILHRLLADARAACLGAMLFAVHPVQVESVAWAAGLKDVLAGMLGLIAIWQYVIFAQGSRKPVHFILATLAFIAAMLAKPSALVVPIIVGAIDLLLIGRPLRVVIKCLAGWGLLSIACMIVGRIAQPAIGVARTPLWVRPFVAGDALTFYLYKLVLPISLAVDYGRRPLELMEHGGFYLMWIPPVIVALLLWRVRKHWPQLLVGGIIFVAAVGPVLGLVTFLFQHYSTTADHYLYLAMLGPALIVAWLVRQNRPIILMTVSFALGLLCIRTVLQARVWKNDLALFSNTLSVNPRSFMAMTNLGHVAIKNEDLATAESYFQAAVDRLPEAEALENLATALEKQFKIEQAIPLRQRAMEIRIQRPRDIQGDLAALHSILAADYAAIGRWSDSWRSLLEAIRLDPANLEFQKSLEMLEEKIRNVSTQPATSTR